jgi:hypothetical protein
VTQPVEVPRQERLVEIELAAQLLDLLLGGVDAQQLLGGVAREPVDDQEGQEADPPQDRDGRQQAVGRQSQRG